jgi:hypothetical protein
MFIYAFNSVVLSDSYPSTVDLFSEKPTAEILAARLIYAGCSKKNAKLIADGVLSNNEYSDEESGVKYRYFLERVKVDRYAI